MLTVHHQHCSPAAPPVPQRTQQWAQKPPMCFWSVAVSNADNEQSAEALLSIWVPTAEARGAGSSGAAHLNGSLV